MNFTTVLEPDQTLNLFTLNPENGIDVPPKRLNPLTWLHIFTTKKTKLPTAFILAFQI
jgi:hypothetical protein